MRFQSTLANCGPAALRTALAIRGILRTQEELEALSGCTTEGTSPKGMLAALRAISSENPDISPDVISETNWEVALLKLLEAHRSGFSVILCVDRDEHWVVSFGFIGQVERMRIHVSDAGDSELVKHYRPGELVERWRGLGRRPYYGIVV